MEMSFIHEDFLLDTPAARTLYHEYAEGLPIIDYHCHLPPKEIAEDKRWENISQVWLYGDHYKWRTMRSHGLPERLCTGDATDREKFDAFAGTMPYLLRNPMYHWCHLELARYFGVDDLLSPKTAAAIWEKTSEVVRGKDFSARGLMRQSGVELVCTTDDPTDDLHYHKAIAADASFKVRVLPAWRPDKGIDLRNEAAWLAWMAKLEAAEGRPVRTWDDFLGALQERHDFFHAAGCRLSDYGIAAMPAGGVPEAEAKAVFDLARAGTQVDPAKSAEFLSYMLRVCGRMDARSDWTWQLHINAIRNNNRRLFKALGPDIGCDSIGDWPVAEAMSALLGDLDETDELPRTILYSLNPCDNELLGSMLGNFQRDPTPGKVQLGSGWWFNDQMDGMKRQIEALSQLGLLAHFVGMLTDSRSFLSYTRHEYFRRILCGVFGRDIEAGLVPNDIPWVGQVVRGICHDNAASYFKF